MLALNSLFRFLAVPLLILFLSLQADAARYAVVISCRAGNAQLHHDNKVCCSELFKLLKQKDFKQISVFFEGGDAELKGSIDVERPAIVEEFNQLAEKLMPEDQLWLFILGHANASERRVSLATAKGRLSGKQLASLLGEVKGEQFIFCLNTQSHGLMRLLSRPKRLVLCASDSYQQLNPPVFTAFFIKTWADNKDAGLFDIAKKAGSLTEEFYRGNNLAAAENSQIYYEGRTLSYPFDGRKSKWLSFSMPETASSPSPRGFAFTPEAAGIKVQPATRQTLELLASARQAAAKYPQHAAVYIRRDFKLTLEPGNSARIAVNEEIYLNRDSAAEIFGVFRVPVMAGSTSRVSKAMIIYPNGTYADFRPDSKDFRHLVLFSGLSRDCLLRRGSEINVPPPAQLPDYNHDLPLQRTFPVLATQIKVQAPKDSPLRCKLYNCDAVPEISSSQYSQNYLFKINSLPAYSFLPCDPDQLKITVHLFMSTMKDWEDFAAWSGRMFKRAEKVDAAAETFIRKLVEGCKDDTEKVKRIYDFLCGLRYLTVPVGAGAFRPRLPGVVISSRYGDCKDKANALVALSGKLGIKGFRAIVNRGRWTDKSFPAWQFNHMLAYFPKLPGYPDGLWLDATDGATSFGALPPGDAGRTAMLFKGDSFEFKTITLSGNVKNLINCSMTLKPGDNPEKVIGTVEIKAAGLPDYQLRQKIKRLTPRQLDFFMHNLLNSFLPGFTVRNFEILTELTDITKPFKLSIETEGRLWMLKAARNTLGSQLWEQLSFPHRKYGIVLNDGQDLRLVQTLTWSGRTLDIPVSEWRKENQYVAINFSARQTKTFSQSFELELKKPEIPAQDYSQVRELISDFKNTLNGSQ
jgi:hypothetical protein